MLGSVVSKVLCKKAYDHLNGRRLDTFLASWADDAVFTFPGSSNAAGVHRGKDAIRAFFERMFAQYEHFEFTVQRACVERLLDLMGSNSIIVEWTIRGRSVNGTEFVNTGVTVIQMRFGKAVAVKDYIFDLEILDRAWA